MRPRRTSRKSAKSPKPRGAAAAFLRDALEVLDVLVELDERVRAGAERRVEPMVALPVQWPVEVLCGVCGMPWTKNHERCKRK